MIMDALKDENGRPRNNMKRALVFQAVIAAVVAPLPVCLGLFGRNGRVVRRRWEMDRRERERQGEDRESSVEDEGVRREGDLRI